MKRKTVIILLLIALIFSWLIYSIMHAPLYDMGTRGENSNFLAAEYEKNNSRCSFTIIDSTQIEITAGTTDLLHSTKRICSISGDTIIVNGNIKELKPYINTNKLLLSKYKLYFYVDSKGNYDTLYAAHVWLNRTKAGN